MAPLKAKTHLIAKYAALAIILARACIAGQDKATATPAEIRAQFDVRIPMRDGVHLSADIWMPSAPGRYPSIIIRTPYLKNWDGQYTAAFYASHGYVFIVQDVRGRGDSEGEFNYFFADAHDGYDTVEWVAAQPWSNGRVGMTGHSYSGTVQWLAARERPPHLVCIAPSAAAGRTFDEMPYQGGAFLMELMLNWLNLTSYRASTGTEGLDMQAIYKHRPLLTMDDALGRRMRLFREFLEHDTLDNYWKRIQFTNEDFEKIEIPALHATGWFDVQEPGALFYWRGMSSSSPAKDKQFLIVGPWNHWQVALGGKDNKLGEFAFPDSVVDLTAIQLAFFDHFLKGSTPNFDFPRARIYTTGSNKWHDEQKYPLADTSAQSLYFHSQGKANTLSGDGRLTWVAPMEEPADHYTYSPDNPVSPGNSDLGSADARTDQRFIERREDVLVYTSEIVKEPLTTVGKVFVHLFASSDALDTDFTARLLDVYPDGRALQLGPRFGGIIRARYRKGYAGAEMLTPNQIEHYQIELFDIAHTFLPGHAIRVEISSSYAPYINPNSNTGKPVATDTEWKTAHQAIFHDAKHDSYVSLPILPKDKKDN